MSLGIEADLRWMEDRLEEKYDIITTILGEGRNDENEARVLSTIIQWYDAVGITL